MDYFFFFSLCLSAALLTVCSSQHLKEDEKNEKNLVVDNDLESQLTSTGHPHQGLNILMFTLPVTGRSSPMIALGEELTRRGHNVTLCASAELKENNNKTKKHAEKAGMNYLSAHRPSMWQYEALKVKKNSSVSSLPLDAWRDEIHTTLSFWFDHLSPQGLTQWDFIIADNFLTIAAMCIHRRTSIPVLLLSPDIHSLFQFSKQWLVPSLMVGGGISMKQISFFERFKVLAVDVYFSAFLKYGLLSSESGSYCSGISLDYLTTDSSSYVPLILPTVIGIEYPRTVLPMTHYVGPLFTKSPDPLSEDLEQWLKDKPEKTVVYISMGSIFNITEATGKAFINGVLQTNYSAIWALRQPEIVEGLEVDPKRVFITKWAPQLRILQQNAISMAILHGGNNGIHEALYNGVPLIVVPFSADQPGNTGRVVDQGLGVSLDSKTITAEAITNSINEIESGDYRRNVERVQKILKSAGGVEKAADLVEYYKDVGFDHLIPGYAKYEWSWVQYYNVDVYCMLAGILVTIIYCSLKCCQCVCGRCCWKERSGKEKKE